MATSGETSDRMPLWIHQSQSPTLRRMGMVGWSHEVDMKFDGKTFSFNHFFGASKVKVVCLAMISLPLLLIGVPLAVPVSCCSWRDVSTHGLLCLDPCGIICSLRFQFVHTWESQKWPLPRAVPIDQSTHGKKEMSGDNSPRFSLKLGAPCGYCRCVRFTRAQMMACSSFC